MVSAHSKIGNENDDHVMAVGQEIVCAIADLENGVDDKVGSRVGHNEFVIQLVWLVISVASVVEDKWIYKG